MEAVKKITNIDDSQTSSHVKVLGASKSFSSPQFSETQTVTKQLTPNEPPLEVGTVLLGRYMLMRLIAQGGTSFIYRARDMLAVLGEDQEQSHIAIKVVKQLDSEVAGSQLMLYEALTTRHLAHPNIIKVYDYHRDGDINFVTMELISGESLAELLTRSPDKKLNFRHAMAIIRSVAEALQAAHDQGVIHSDIKPSNILMTDHGDVKVIDFATARPTLDALQSSATIHHDAKFYGYTLAYASPQTIADMPAKPSDDVFSLACIVYETISGRHPYQRQASSSPEAEAIQLNKPQGINIWQWRVLKKALSLNEGKRYQSVQRFMKAFDRARFTWSYILFVGLLSLGAVFAYQAASENPSRQQFWSGFIQNPNIQQQEMAEQILQIRNLPGLERVKALSLLDGSPSLLRAGAIGELRAEVVDPIVTHVQTALNYDLGKYPDFTELLALLDAARVYYPDSASLSSTRVFVQTEQEQLRTSLTVEYRQTWAETDFSLAHAAILNELTMKLSRLNAASSVVEPEEQVINRYEQSLNASMATMDFQQIDKLFLFANALSKDIDSQFIRQWRAINSSIPVAANSLVEYIGLEQPTSDQYPQQALEHIVAPVFKSLEKQIEDVWSDNDIVATKEKLVEAVENFALPEELSLLQQAKQRLVSKINAKIKFHEAEKNDRSLRRLRRLLGDIG